jgi:hypothetical protein
MHLRALSMGYAVPGVNFDANIHSVFHTAVNLKPENNNLLLTLVAASEADLPQGIRVDCPGDFSFDRLSVGQSASSRDGCLVFGDSVLEVEFRNCRRWQCNLPAMGTDLTQPAVAEAWRWVWEMLNARQISNGAEIVAEALLHADGIDQPAITRRLRESTREITVTMRNNQLNGRLALTRLIGLGTGLTPSGDDFLVGYLAGLWCTIRDIAQRQRLVMELGQTILQRSGRTNDISRTYLYHAACGQVSSRLEALATAISKPQDPAKIRTAAESAMRSGHTSGMDAVTGLLFAMANWDGEKLLSVA